MALPKQRKKPVRMSLTLWDKVMTKGKPHVVGHARFIPTKTPDNRPQIDRQHKNSKGRWGTVWSYERWPPVTGSKKSAKDKIVATQ